MPYDNTHLYHLHRSQTESASQVHPLPSHSSDSDISPLVSALSTSVSSPPAEEDAQVLTPLDVLTEDLLPSSETDPLGAFLAGKRAFLAKSVEDILGLIYEREELLRQNLCAIDRDETKTRLHFYEIEHWMTRRLDPQVEKLRGNLERDLLNLAKDRRAEEVACWRDTTRLRTDLRDSLREAWREKQRQDLLGEQR